MLAAIAQSVQRPATGWTDRKSIRNWGLDFPHWFISDLECTQPAAQWLQGTFRGQNDRGAALTTQLHSKTRLKKEYNRTYPPPRKLHGLLHSELYNIFFSMLHYGVS